MRLLFAGDVVGRPGRRAICALIPELRRRLRLDAVVVNCENAADGRGILPDQADALLAAGVDVLTGGNHLLTHRAILPYLARQPRLVRSANDDRAPGHGACAVRLGAGRLGVIQVEGQVFMRKHLSCPFAAVRRELARLGPCDAILLDVHAEASSEKQALAHAFVGRVSAVLGTHTHVQTADERILGGATAYLTDVGMTGPYDSIIGMEVDLALSRFLQPERPREHGVASGDVRLCAALVDIAPGGSGRATHIERLQIPLEGGLEALQPARR